MRVAFVILFSFCFVGQIFGSYKSCIKDDIVGFWITPKDEVTGRVNIVKIIKKQGQYFAYRVSFMDSLPSYDDINNSNFALRDRNILGSVFIYNLERNSEFNYSKGRYYDFNNGKTFHLRARLECRNLHLIISVDNVGILGTKKIYKFVPQEDAIFYINQNIEPNFSGVE